MYTVKVWTSSKKVSFKVLQLKFLVDLSDCMGLLAAVCQSVNKHLNAYCVPGSRLVAGSRKKDKINNRSSVSVIKELEF